MRLNATTLDELKIELERVLNAPGQPLPVFACATADMPPAADHPHAVLHNTTLDVLAYSNGAAWIRADTKAAI